MKIFLLLLLAPVAFGETGAQPHTQILQELPGVRLGMSTKDLLKTRPNILRIGMSGAPVDMEAPGLFLTERLPRDGIFSSASFTVKSGKLVSVMVMGHPKRGEERASRRKFVAECIARWGKDFKRRLPKDAIRPEETIPTLTWERGDVEYILTIPKDRQKGDTKMSPVILQARTLAIGKKTAWKEPTMTDAERDSVFDANDVPSNRSENATPRPKTR